MDKNKKIAEKMKKTVLDKSDFVIFSSLKELAKLKNLNYPYLSNQLSGKVKNNTNYVYAKKIDFNQNLRFISPNGQTFCVVSLFETRNKETLAIILVNETKCILLSEEQCSQYPFNITEQEIEIIKFYQTEKRIKIISKKFNQSIPVIDRIILKYGSLDLNKIVF